LGATNARFSPDYDRSVVCIFEHKLQHSLYVMQYFVQ